MLNPNFPIAFILIPHKCFKLSFYILNFFFFEHFKTFKKYLLYFCYIFPVAMPVHQVSVVCGFCKLGTVVNDICGPLHKSHLKNGSVCAAHHRCMVS